MTQVLLISLALSAPAAPELSITLQFLRDKAGVSYSIENGSKKDVVFSTRWDFLQIVASHNGETRYLSTFYRGVDNARLGVRSMITLAPRAMLVGEVKFHSAPQKGEQVFLQLSPVTSGAVDRIAKDEVSFLLSKVCKSNVISF